MKLFFPGNVYSRLLADNLPDALKKQVVFLAPSSIPNELKKDEYSIGLITPTDMLTNPEIFISSKAGISFEGILSNSYIYFQPGQKDFNSLSLFGDVTSIEVILSKIFFKENYNSDIQIEILSGINKSQGKNLLAAGDINFSYLNFNKGLSFAEEIADMLSLPFVNFVLGSFNSKALEDLNISISGISQKIYDSIEKGNFGSGINDSAMEYIKENAASLIYEFEDQDIDDIHQLLRLPYFYGIIQDIIEPKFI
jgi:hypothetical protein